MRTVDGDDGNSGWDQRQCETGRVGKVQRGTGNDGIEVTPLLNSQRWCVLPPPSTWTLLGPAWIPRSVSRPRTATRWPRERLQGRSGISLMKYSVIRLKADAHSCTALEFNSKALKEIHERTCLQHVLSLQSGHDKGLRGRLGGPGALWAPPCLWGRWRADWPEGETLLTFNTSNLKLVESESTFRLHFGVCMSAGFLVQQQLKGHILYRRDSSTVQIYTSTAKAACFLPPASRSELTPVCRNMLHQVCRCR